MNAPNINIPTLSSLGGRVFVVDVTRGSVGRFYRMGTYLHQNSTRRSTKENLRDPLMDKKFSWTGFMPDLHALPFFVLKPAFRHINPVCSLGP